MKIMRFLCILGFLLIGTTTFAADGDMIVNGQVGVGRTAPASKLDVNGGVRIGSDSTTCSSAIEGEIRYNSTSKTMEFCNGTSWMAVVNSSQPDSYTKLLLHMDGVNGSTAFTDSSGDARTITAYNGAQIKTDRYKFGGASGAFLAAGDRITVNDSDDWYFGNGDFTIDFWVLFTDLTELGPFAGQWESYSSYWYIWREPAANGNKLKIKFAYGGVVKGEYIMTNDWQPATNIWYHLAFVRNGSSCLIFINGVSQTLTESTSFSTNDVGNLAGTSPVAALFIATESHYGYHIGYLDEFRISKGIARWTSNFTPPTAPY